ncbi:hypothetical protein IF1G_01197 [Cordyceps javanica]|uniref:Uncharacterized protein n=1 Tax=Cordyceps javanica TaxID=43265 RepID=A0A545VHZ5_9HYPO|nr:hypothetical protein IF1G_01197 [Cordyceps javanica]
MARPHHQCLGSIAQCRTTAVISLSNRYSSGASPWSSKQGADLGHLFYLPVHHLHQRINTMENGLTIALVPSESTKPTRLVPTHLGHWLHSQPGGAAPVRTCVASSSLAFSAFLFTSILVFEMFIFVNLDRPRRNMLQSGDSYAAPELMNTVIEYRTR